MEKSLEVQSKSETISHYIRSCSRIIHKRGHKIAEEYGLTYYQFHILLYLNKQNLPPSVNDIAKSFNRAQNTTSEQISELAKKDLVNKVDDENDRRITRIIITDKGKGLIDTIKEERNIKIVSHALESMDKGEVDNLLNNLNKLYESLKEGD